jgi:hypothetical protein
MYVMAPDPISVAYFPSVCVSPLIVARQGLCKHVRVATNTRNNRTAGGVVLYTVRVVSKGSLRVSVYAPDLVTSTVALRVVGGDEERTQCLGV